MLNPLPAAAVLLPAMPLAQGDGALLPGGEGLLILVGAFGAALGAVLFWLFFLLLQRQRVIDTRKQTAKMVKDAERKARSIRDRADADARLMYVRLRDELDKESAETRRSLESRQDVLEAREQALSAQRDRLEAERDRLDSLDAAIRDKTRDVDALKKQYEAHLAEAEAELQRISGLEPEKARTELMTALDKSLQKEAAERIRQSMEHAEQTRDDKVRDLLLDAMQQHAVRVTTSQNVTYVDLPSDDMKGRIIGQQGRNINAFQKLTGADLIIDETPSVVTVSCFDPVRREIAVQTLKKLVEDGRIHPARIEDALSETQEAMQHRIQQLGEEAIVAADIVPPAAEVVPLLGKLNFRQSYGQNVLEHSIEVALMCGRMAAELGLDPQLARRAGLLHDVGKALDDELDGPHTKIGADVLRRNRENEAVVNAAEAHHGDVAVTSPYTTLVSTADAVSAARPGARNEKRDVFLKRMGDLEAIAQRFDGVREVFAVQAGRELRILADADKVDDAASAKLARDIASAVQAELTFPGEVRVAVIREYRVDEYAR